MALISTSSTTDTDPSSRIGSDEIYDLRGEDERSASTYMNGVTILSSAASSTPTTESLNGGSNSGMVHVPIESSLSLSLNPSMINSSVLLPSNTDVNGNWIDFNGIPLMSEASTSSSEASTASGSTSCTPGVLVNIGRSMMHASQSTSTTGSDTETATDKLGDKLSTPRTADSGKRLFAHLQTDEDWDHFRSKAKDYLNTLVTQEMKDMKHNDDSSNCTDNSAKVNQSSHSQGLWQWIQAVYVSINAAMSGIGHKNDSTKSQYYSELVKEIVKIEGELKNLPPMPPSLSLGGLPLDDIPEEKRRALEDYQIRLNAWKGEIMPQHEELTSKYRMCQERLLAAIIDSEEEMFYDKKERGNSFGEVNNDGYIEVVEKHSPAWDDVNEAIAFSQSKCNLATFGAALFAVLTAGAGIVLKLQSQRR